MQRCVIIGGAEIKNYNRIKAKLNNDDFFVFCDSGLKHMEDLKISPDLIVGDFDSVKNPELQVETIVLPVKKDDTDTFYAVKECLKRGFIEFLLIGVTGERLDHTLGNLSILLYLFNQGKEACIVDDFSVLRIVGKDPVYVKNAKYFSLMNINGTAKGVNIINALYPLKDATVTGDYSYCVSNQLLKDKQAQVFVNNGQMLLIIVEEEG